MLTRRVGGLLVAAACALAALDVDLDSPDSIKSAAKLVAQDLLTFYHGDEPGMVPGILPGPPPAGDYYWWQGGAMWGTLLDYWHFTGDDSFNDEIFEAMQFQVGEKQDYNPANWSASMGNDDQAFWGMSAMLAAELGFQDPPKEDPQWLYLVQAVFNEQTSPDRRVTEGACKGGLRWQVYPSNQGFDYINTIANACYFNLGARLARYTENDTYASMASDTWDTITRLGYIDSNWNVYDGGHLPKECKDINKAQFSYNAAVLLQGAAFMYNHTTGDEHAQWESRINSLLARTIEVFFPNGTAYELPCEGTPVGCNTDMESYKGYTHRWLASTAQMAPFTKTKIMPVLKSSTQNAVKQCTGGSNGRMCGFHWTTGNFDGEIGASMQMNVLAALTSLLDAPGPFTNTTGGTSQGDVNAGAPDELKEFAPITAGDKAGAAILTMLLIGAAASGFWFMSTD